MDMRCSAKDLIRNHLTMSLYTHAAIWPDQQMETWTRSYMCNGYLMLNGEKMSKSTGNFLTLRQTMDKYGVDASRIALCDAGDSLDDANFADETANAAILKLFVLEGWIKTWVAHCVPEGGNGPDFEKDHRPEEYDTWDRIMLNQTNQIVQTVEHGYRRFVYRDIIKYGFNEMLNLKETYLIGKNQKPNPFVMLHFIETVLKILNPVVPSFAENSWQTVVRPALLKCPGCPEPKEKLVDQGWPKLDKPVDPTTS